MFNNVNTDPAYFNDNKAEKVYRVKARVPCRIHQCVKDMSSFDFGKPGGGSYGFAIDRYMFIDVEIAHKPSNEIYCRRKKIIEKAIDIVKNLYGYKNVFFKVTVTNEFPEHIGLGSSSILMFSIIYILNLLMGNKIQKKELVRLYINNSVEEGEFGLICNFETGLSTWLMLEGGFCLVDDKINLVSNIKIYNKYVMLAYFDNDKKISGGYERDLLLGKCRSSDLTFKIDKHKLFDIELKKAMTNFDIDKIGKITKILNDLGSKKYEIKEHYMSKLLIKFLNDKGYNFVGMSSLGSTVYLLDDYKNILDVKKIIKNNFECEISINKIDNEGICIEDGISKRYKKRIVY